jgi:hypothetical protein
LSLTETVGKEKALANSRHHYDTSRGRFQEAIVYWRPGIAVLIYVLSLTVLLPFRAYAVPSFARQTGFRCAMCHTAFPQLTPFGREFKLNGYVLSNEQSKLPPVAVMFMPSFTHTAEGQAPSAAKYFHKNNNFALTQASFFYSGRLFGPYAESLFGKSFASIANKFGTFIQGTYDGVGRQWSWDNWEIRFANSTSIKNTNVVYGAYVNNNPTMQDLWNTTPAWGFPFSSSGLAPTPSAAPLIAGGVAQQVLGTGAYARFFDLVYVELGGYRTLGKHVQESLGVPADDVSDETQITDFAPYWRLAVEKRWGSHSLEAGTYGIAPNTFPGRDRSAGKDHVLDIGLDSQYQYSSAPHDLTLMLNWINENDRWHASQALGKASHSRDSLWNFTATASYLFDKTYGADFQYFLVSGDKDPLLYADSRTGSPTSDGWILQLDYLPLNKRGGPSFWPFSNVKFSLQYWIYNRFDGSRHNYDGSGRDATDNNTLYLQAWFAF